MVVHAPQEVIHHRFKIPKPAEFSSKKVPDTSFFSELRRVRFLVMKVFYLKYQVVILIVLVLGGLFYWFQLRPAFIKKECSWVEKHTEAVPEVTQADIDQAKIDSANCNEIKYPENRIQTVAEWKEANAAAHCRLLATGGPRAAVPPKTYYEPASSAQYSQCLHAHGL